MFRGLAKFASKRFQSHGHHATPEISFRSPNLTKAKAFLEYNKHVSEHSGKTASLWYKISLFVALPAIILCSINTWGIEMKHAEHREHLKHIPDEDWPRNREYQNVRYKPFFWGDGDKTLFWNDGINRNVSKD